MIQEHVKLFKALGNETRLKIIDLLLDGEKCVCEIFPNTDRAQSTVSIHLRRLEEMGILSCRKEGKKMLYKIQDPRVFQILETLDFEKSEKIGR